MSSFTAPCYPRLHIGLPTKGTSVFGQVGWPQLLIVLVIVLVIFGAKRLPEVGRSLGSGMREFKEGIKGEDDDATAERTITSGEDVEHKH